MKRMKKQFLSLALASAMLISGCGSQSSSTGAAVSTKNADGKYDPVLTITVAKQLDENAGRYGDGEDINKNPMVDLAVEKLGIKMETTLLGGDANNYDTKLWQRLVSLGGVVNGRTCDMGLYHTVIDMGETVPCSLQVRRNHILAQVGEWNMEHACLSAMPDELYYSAVKDEEGNVIVKLANLTQEEKKVRIETQKERRNAVVHEISGCSPEWRNSFEEPNKVSPETKKLAVEGKELAWQLAPYSLAVIRLG